MKKIFNKSTIRGLLFAVSSYWMYYLIFWFCFIPDLPDLPNWLNNIMSYIVGGILFFAFPIHFGVICIPEYFLLRRKVENKTVYTVSCMFLSVLLSIPLYILSIFIYETKGLGEAIVASFAILYLSSVLLVTFIICTADIIICILKKHNIKISKIICVAVSILLLDAIFFVVFVLEYSYMVYEDRLCFLYCLCIAASVAVIMIITKLIIGSVRKRRNMHEM